MTSAPRGPRRPLPAPKGPGSVADAGAGRAPEEAVAAAAPALGADQVPLDQAEQSLRHSQSLQRSLLANLPDTTVFLLDRELRILVAQGDAVRRLPWLTDDLFFGRRVEDLDDDVPVDILETAMRHYADAFRGNASAFEFTSAGLTFEVRVVPVRSADGEVESALVIARDVTATRSIQQELALRAAQQEAVARLGRYALGERDLRALMDEVVGTVATGLDMSHSGSLAIEDNGATLRMVAGRGWDPALIGTMRLRSDEDSQAVHTLSSSAPVVVDDDASEARFTASAVVRKMGFRSGISVVVQGTTGPFGLLGAHGMRPTA